MGAPSFPRFVQKGWGCLSLASHSFRFDSPSSAPDPLHTVKPAVRGLTRYAPGKSGQQSDSSVNPADTSACTCARRVQQIAPYAPGHEMRGESVARG